MSSFTKEIQLGPFEFDGDSITLVVRRLKRKDLKKIQPFLMSDGKGSITVDPLQSLDMIDSIAPILPKRVISVSGFSPESETEKALEIILDESYFLNLLVDMITQLMEKSFYKPGKKEEKKSDNPSTNLPQDEEEETRL